MTIDENMYKKRLIEKKLETYLSVFGAVSIEGPKWCGKTWTSIKHSKSQVYMDDYDVKESLLHTIFEKSQVSDTELFALDINVAIQLLSSFEGTVIYPKTETKEEIFTGATENTHGKLIPNGTYTFKRRKKSDKNKLVHATAIINNGRWTLLKGSVLGMAEDMGVSQKAKKVRASIPIDSNGKLLEDFELGECSPSHAGTVVMNQSNNGWADWHNGKGQPVDIYRSHAEETN